MIKLTCEGMTQERLAALEALEGKINEAAADRLAQMMYTMRDPMPNCRCIIVPNDDPDIIDAPWEYVKPMLVEHIKDKP